MSESPEDQQINDCEKQQLVLFQKFVADFEELSITHSGSFDPLEIRHVNVISFIPGWEEYMTAAWHKHETDLGVQNWQCSNLLMAGLEPFILFLEREEMEREEDKKPFSKFWSRFGYWNFRLVFSKFLRPRWFWESIIWKSTVLTRWETMKVNLAFYLLGNINYRHR